MSQYSDVDDELVVLISSNTIIQNVMEKGGEVDLSLRYNVLCSYSYFYKSIEKQPYYKQYFSFSYRLIFLFFFTGKWNARLQRHAKH